MSADRSEQHGPENVIQPELTPTQNAVREAILETLRIKGEARVLIIVEGMSGVGKSLVVECARSQVEESGGQIATTGDIVYSYEGKNPLASKASIVTTATRGEVQKIRDAVQSKNRKITLISHVLQGMDSTETDKFVDSLSLSLESLLNKEQIKRYSLGVPLLARRLMLPGINEQMAISLCAQYLLENCGRYLKPGEIQKRAAPYLRVGIPKEVLTACDEVDHPIDRRIYDFLPYILEKMEKLKTEGISEELPIFIAPQSERIYDEMLRTREFPRIDIFIPGLNVEDLERLKEALGYDPERNDFGQGQKNRAEMFGVYYRKTSFWVRDFDSQDIFADNEDQSIQERVENYIKAQQEGEIPILMPSEPTASMLVQAHDHHNLNSQAAIVGWMVESLLQQRGIAYFINNEAYGSSYTYNPETRQIENISALFSHWRRN